MATVLCLNRSEKNSYFELPNFGAYKMRNSQQGHLNESACLKTTPGHLDFFLVVRIYLLRERHVSSLPWWKPAVFPWQWWCTSRLCRWTSGCRTKTSWSTRERALASGCGSSLPLKNERQINVHTKKTLQPKLLWLLTWRSGTNRHSLLGGLHYIHVVRVSFTLQQWCIKNFLVSSFFAARFAWNKLY